jgi:hypothetical protein
MRDFRLLTNNMNQQFVIWPTLIYYIDIRMLCDIYYIHNNITLEKFYLVI